MAAIVNARDVLLQAAGTRFVTPVLTGTVDFATQVTGAQKPSNNADVTSTILSSAGTSIVMSNANLFKSSSGLGGVFIGSSGLVGRDSGGSTTFSIDGSTGAASFAGNITGGSNINITGQGSFGGQNSVGGFTMAISANPSALANTGGIYARGQGTAPGVYGSSQGNASGGPGGVQGATDTGIGVLGQATGSGVGVYATSVSGAALYIAGTVQITSTTAVTNLNADLLDGNHASAFATAGHNHAGVYLPVAGTAADSSLLQGNAASAFATAGHNHSGTYVAGNYTAGNSSGNVPVSNGTMNTNLNAEKWNGNTCGNTVGSATAVPTWAGSNKPGSDSSNVWWLVNINGTNYYIPVWT